MSPQNLQNLGSAVAPQPGRPDECFRKAKIFSKPSFDQLDLPLGPNNTIESPARNPQGGKYCRYAIVDSELLKQLLFAAQFLDGLSDSLRFIVPALERPYLLYLAGLIAKRSPRAAPYTPAAVFRWSAPATDPSLPTRAML
jgi:hypothetical protein